VKIRPMWEADADAVLRIYQAGLDSGQASFETTAPPWAAFDAGKLPDHRYVAVDEDSGGVLGVGRRLGGVYALLIETGVCCG
jgi:arsenite methyltransferase